MRQTVGGTSDRYSALINGQLPNGTAVYATILNYPFVQQGEALGDGQSPNILERIKNVVAPITSSVFTVRETSLHDSQTSGRLVKFIEAMYAADRFLLDPSNASCCIAAIQAQLNVSTVVATAEYQSATDPISGEISPPENDFTVNQRGIMTIAMIRRSFAGFSGVPANFDFEAALTPGRGQLIDYSIRNQAMQQYNPELFLSSCVSVN